MTETSGAPQLNPHPCRQFQREPTPPADACMPANVIRTARKELDMSTLEVPGAILHYQAQGSGPILVLIPGQTGRRGYSTPRRRAAGRLHRAALRPARLFGQPA
jgi:hypothetical protein